MVECLDNTMSGETNKRVSCDKINNLFNEIINVIPNDVNKKIFTQMRDVSNTIIKKYSHPGNSGRINILNEIYYELIEEKFTDSANFFNLLFILEDEKFNDTKIRLLIRLLQESNISNGGFLKFYSDKIIKKNRKYNRNQNKKSNKKSNRKSNKKSNKK